MCFFPRNGGGGGGGARSSRVGTSRLKRTRERRVKTPNASTHLPIAPLVPDASRGGHKRALSAEGGENQKPKSQNRSWLAVSLGRPKRAGFASDKSTDSYGGAVKKGSLA